MVTVTDCTNSDLVIILATVPLTAKYREMGMLCSLQAVAN